MDLEPTEPVIQMSEAPSLDLPALAGDLDGPFDRASPASARAVIERLLPVAEERRVCLEILSDSLVRAHQIRDTSWGVTLHSDQALLIVGKFGVCEVLPNELYLKVDAESFAPNELPDLAASWPGKRGGQNHPSDLRAFGVHIPSRDVAGIPLELLEAHRRYVDRAANRVRTRAHFQHLHSPGVLTYLENELGEPLPEPNFAVQDESSRTDRSWKTSPSEADLAEIAGREPPPNVDLADTLGRSLRDAGLHYTDWQIATFVTALQTKGFVILSGISGTGKSKLAQHVAGLLSAPTALAPPPADAIVITTKPYMVKYGSCVVPKRAAHHLQTPALGQSWRVEVSLDGHHETCRFARARGGSSDGFLEIYLKGGVRQAFRQRFQVGDRFLLDLTPDEDQRLTRVEIVPEDQWPAVVDSPVSAPESNALFLSVRPDWRDGKSLLGYHNPLSGEYEWTPFLRFVLRAAASYEAEDGHAWFVILDEMNLAHVEYYFADFLSVLESGRDEGGWTREGLYLGDPDATEGDVPPPHVRLPPNLYLIGTVNMDETTHAFSPKVLDRAFTLELTDVDFSAYPVILTGEDGNHLSDGERQALAAAFTRNGRFARIEKRTVADHVVAHPEIRARLDALNSLLRPHHLHFGYRVFDEIVSFCDAAEENGLFANIDGDMAPFDAAVLMKVLPKFHGSRGRLEAPLRAVIGWSVNPDAPAIDLIDSALQTVENAHAASMALDRLDYRCPCTAERARRMLWTLYVDGFAAFG